VIMKSSIFWYVTPCGLLKVNQCFGGICCLHLQDRRISWARNQHENRWHCSPSSSHLSLDPPTFLLPSGLLSKITFACLVWPVLITFPNHSDLPLIGAIRSVFLHIPLISWIVLILQTPCSVTGPYTCKESNPSFPAHNPLLIIYM
jgi:hypothetical protein